MAEMIMVINIYILRTPMSKSNHYNKMSSNSLYNVISHLLTEEDVKSIDTTITQRDPGTKTTPEEITQRAYFNKKRSEGDVSPEDKAKYDAAFKDQQAAFGQMSPGSQKRAALMWGNPMDPNYRTVEFNLAKGKFADPLVRGLKHDETEIPGRRGVENPHGRFVTISKDTQSNTVVPHEMTHQQQYATIDYASKDGIHSFADVRKDKSETDYRKKDMEAGAQSKGELVSIRNQKPPEDTLKPLTPKEVDTALEKTRGPGNGYVGFEDEPENVKAELKKYMEKMIVQNPKNQSQGTAVT